MPPKFPKISQLILYLLMGIILLMLGWTPFQHKFRIFTLTPLNGAISYSERPAFNIDSLLSGQYQASYQKFIEDSLPFKPCLVRINNQIDFSAFGQLHAKLAVVGKKGILFENTYVDSYLGKDFIGDSGVRKKIGRLMDLKRNLAQHNVRLILVFSPSKARFMPENLSDDYLEQPKKRSNYDAYTEILEKENPGLDFIDFNRYFRLMKDTSEMPLYSKGGTHWSIYGALRYASDSLLKYMETVSGKKIADIHFKGVVWSKSLREPDNDISSGLNLLLPYPSPPMAYPVYEVKRDSLNWRPKVLIVADSYYWILYSSQIFAKPFAAQDFWFYNEQHVPASKYASIEKNPLLMKEDLLSHDFVVLMITEINLPYMLGFPEKTIALLDPENTEIKNFLLNKQKRILECENLIRNNPEWMKLIISKARQANTSVEKQLHADAEYTVERENK